MQGMNSWRLAITLMNLSCPLKSSAFLEIYNKDPPLNDDSMIGSKAEL